MKSLVEYILENSKTSLLESGRSETYETFDGVIKGMNKSDLEYFCKIAVKGFQIPEDIRKIVSAYELQTMRKTFSKKLSKDDISFLTQRLEDLFDSQTYDNVLKEMTKGAKGESEQLADVVQHIINRAYVLNKKKLEECWPKNPDEILKNSDYIQ